MEEERHLPIDLEHVKHLVSQAHAAGQYRRLEGRERVSAFISRMVLEPKTELHIGPNKYTVEEPSFLVFIDLMHDANFAHPVIYELHGVNTGNVRTIEEKWPIHDKKLAASLVPHILPPKGGK